MRFTQEDEVGAEGFVVFEGDFKTPGNLRSAEEFVEVPAEEGLGEGREFGEEEFFVAVAIEPGLEEGEEVLVMKRKGAAVDAELLIGEDGWGDDEAFGLEVADPSLVILQ